MTLKHKICSITIVVGVAGFITFIFSSLVAVVYESLAKGETSLALIAVALFFAVVAFLAYVVKEVG